MRSSVLHLWRKVVKCWIRATEPDESVPERERQGARLLASMLLVLLMMGVYQAIVAIVWSEARLRRLPTEPLLILGAALVLAFFWKRSGSVHYRRVAWGLIVISNVAIFWHALPIDDPSHTMLQVYLIIPILLSSIWCSWPVAVGLTLANVVGLALVPAFFDTVTLYDMWIGFLLSVSGLLILLVHHLVLVDETRQSELSEARARYRQLVEYTPVAIGVFQDSRLVYANPAGVGLLGGDDLDDVVGMTFEDVLPPENREPAQRRLQRVLAGEPVAPFHERLIRRDGTIIDAEMVVIPFTYEGRSAVQMVASDITARLATENALRRSEAQQRALLNAIPDLLFRFSRDGFVIDVQAEGKEDMLVGDRRSIIGRKIEDDVPVEYGAQLRAAIERALDTGAMQVMEYQLEIDGLLHDFEGRVVVSGPQDVLYIVRDISARKATENALLISERQNRAMLAAMPDIMLQFDRQGVVLGVNAEGVEKLLLAPASEILGKPVNQFIPPELAADLQGRINRALTGVTQVWEYTLNLPIGQRVFESRMVASGDSQVLVVIRDITERHRIDEAIRRRDDILEILATMSGRLMKSSDLEVGLRGAITYLGQALDLSYTMLFANDKGPESELTARLHFGWASSGRPLTGVHLRDKPLYMGEESWGRKLALGQPVYGASSDLFHPWQGLAENIEAKSVVAVPIFVEEVWWGFLVLVDCEHERLWLPVEIEVIRSAANALGATILRQRVEQAEREQRTLAETLRDTLAAINRTLEPDTVLDLILTNIERVVPHDAANIALLANNRVRVVRSRGYEAHGCAEWMQSLDVPVDQWATIREVLTGHQPIFVVDTRSDPRWEEIAPTQWIRSNLIAPIRSEQRTIGLLILDSTQPGTFNARHGEVLQMFAEQAAVALTNAHLYDELRRHADELAVLYRGTSFLYSALPAVTSMTDLSDQIVQTIVGTFKRVDCGLLLLDSESGGLDTMARAGDYRIRYPHMLRLDGPGLVASAVRSGEPVYVPDVSLDERYIAGDSRTVSELVIPIKTSSGEPMGALDLQSIERDAFSPQDINVLTVFAERIAAAIENRQLYAEIQRHAGEMEQRVNERTADLSVRNAVAETLSGSLNTAAMLDGVLRTMIERLGVMGGAVFLLNPETQMMELATQHGVSGPVLNALAESVPALWPPAANRPGLPSVAAVLDVPIWRQGQVQGVITLVHNQPRAWSDEEMRMVDAIGRQIGVALANAQLYAEAVRGEARIRAILQSAADGILVFDQAQKLVLINPAGEMLFRFYPAEQGGAASAASRLWTWLQAHTADPESPEAIEFSLPIDSLVSSRQGGRSACAEEQCAYADREDQYWPCWLIDDNTREGEIEQCPVFQRTPRRAIQARSAIVRDPHGEATGTVIVLHDVTYYRELDDLKGRFVSTVSHELRTPLSAILLEISSLSKYYDRFGETERRHIISQVHGQANVLKELIEDILELSRFDARRARPHKQWFDLAAHSRDLIDSMQAVTRDRDLVLDTTQLAGVQYIYGDPHQLMRSLRNLFANAVKYTPDGGFVAVGLERQADHLRLWVKDTGIGVPVEEQLYIFDPFFRSDQASQMASGTGLGLAITREIVELHDGRIDLSSVPGEGSLFTITLPVVVGVEGEPEL